MTRPLIPCKRRWVGIVEGTVDGWLSKRYLDYVEVRTYNPGLIERTNRKSDVWTYRIMMMTNHITIK